MAVPPRLVIQTLQPLEKIPRRMDGPRRHHSVSTPLRLMAERNDNLTLLFISTPQCLQRPSMNFAEITVFP